MTSRRLWILTGLALLLMGGAGISVIAFVHWNKPTKPLSKVRLGMTAEEVESVFGRPADGDASSLFMVEVPPGIPDFDQSEGPKEALNLLDEDFDNGRIWQFEEARGFGLLVFDKSGKLIFKSWWSYDLPERTLSRQVRDWLGL
jgi:hypothetical protein